MLTAQGSGSHSRSSENSFCDRPDISIIIPSYNGARRLPACLKALLELRTTRNYEIIVIIDGSMDNTERVLKDCTSIRYFYQNNLGPAAARNRGVKEARGDIVLFIDDDCIAEPGWLDQMVRPICENPDIVGVKGAYFTRQREWVARLVQIEYEEKYDYMLRFPFIDFIDTYSAGFSREVFLETGGFDPRFNTACTEDQDFSFRLANAGYKMIFNPLARVCHTHVDTLYGYLRKKFKIGYWKILVLTKNPNKTISDSHTPFTLKLQVLLFILLIPDLVLCITLPVVGLPCLALNLALFGITLLPLWYRTILREPGICILLPLFVFCRALGLSCGLLAGGFNLKCG